MATRVVTIEFEECETPPEGGYNVTYRLKDSADPYTDAGSFPGSPAIITIEDVDECDHFEGFIQAVCVFGLTGNPQPWETEPCEEPAAPASVEIMANFDGSITVILPVVGDYEVRIIPLGGEPDCTDEPVDTFLITGDDQGVSGILEPGTYFACVRAICDGGCVGSEYVPSEDSVVVGEPCQIWQNTSEENAADIEWIDCNGNPAGPQDWGPGSNFCAQFDSVSGPGAGNLEAVGICAPRVQADFDLSNVEMNVCTAPTTITLWYEPPFVPFTILTTDSAGLSPQLGFTFVREPGGDAIYNLNAFSGQVGAATGNSCP